MYSQSTYPYQIFCSFAPQIINMQKISKWIIQKAGWTIRISVGEPEKSVICVAPHTSNWDFIIGKLSYWASGRQANFLMKKSWFFFPIGQLLSAMGGVPIDRSRKNSVTQQIADEFAFHKHFHIAITPEGTRSRVESWKMGFYYIAVKAQVPIQLAYLDYRKKEMGITQIFHPTGDEKADMQVIQNFYKKVNARFPEKFNIQLIG